MKKTTKIVAISIAAATLLSGAATFGANLAKRVDIYYRNIKISVDGKEFVPENEQRERVEPFIYDGTTYLPMRAVATAVGMDVSWDDKTNTVSITQKQPDSKENENQNDTKQDSVPDKQPQYEVTEKNGFHDEMEKKLLTFTEKSELDQEILVNVSGVPISAAAVRFAVKAAAYSYDNKTDAETLKMMEEEIDRYYRTNAAVVLLAQENGFDISQEQFTEELAGQYELLQSNYGDSFKEIIEAYTFQTTYYYFLNQYYNLLYNKIGDYLIETDGFADNIKKEVLAEMTSGEAPYVRAKHVLVLVDENATEQQKAEKKALAESILARARKGEDFDVLVKEYGEDPGMNTYPGGYYFTTGVMVEPFENATFALKEGEISDVVDASYGYHIILRLPLDDDAVKDTDEYRTMVNNRVAEFVYEKSQDLTVTYASNYEERYNDFKNN